MRLVVVSAWLTIGCGRFDFVRHDASIEGPPDAPIDAVPCGYQCTIDLPTTTTCVSPIVPTFAASKATATIDLTGYRELGISGAVCDPTGFTLHLGDSPSNDGFGGDAGQFSNDAELQLNGTELDVFASDYAMAPGSLAIDPAFVASSGCTTIDLRVADQTVDAVLPHPYHVSSPTSLRLDATMDLEGVPDRKWWLGVDRTYGNATRNGTGLQHVALCLR